MERLCEVKKALIQKVYDCKDCMDQIDAEELGEVIDIIKDIEMIFYYDVLVDVMHGENEELKEKVLENVAENK